MNRGRESESEFEFEFGFDRGSGRGQLAAKVKRCVKNGSELAAFIQTEMAVLLVVLVD